MVKRLNARRRSIESNIDDFLTASFLAPLGSGTASLAGVGAWLVPRPSPCRGYGLGSYHRWHGKAAYLQNVHADSRAYSKDGGHSFMNINVNIPQSTDVQQSSRSSSVATSYIQDSNLYSFRFLNHPQRLDIHRSQPYHAMQLQKTQRDEKSSACEKQFYRPPPPTPNSHATASSGSWVCCSQTHPDTAGHDYPAGN